MYIKIISLSVSSIYEEQLYVHSLFVVLNCCCDRLFLIYFVGVVAVLLVFAYQCAIKFGKSESNFIPNTPVRPAKIKTKYKM